MLSREQRFESFAVAEEARLVELADRVLARHEVSVLRPPAAGSVMIRAVETAEGSLFNLGEVLVTEAEVELSGERGYCMVMGSQPQKALAGAVLDAAAEAGIEADAIESALRAAGEAERSRRAAEWARLAPTRVTFDEIPG